MKKLTLISLLLCISFSISAVAQSAPARKLNRKNLTNTGIELKSAQATSETVTVLSENFSKFTAGSESTPDGTEVGDATTFLIPSTYTQTAGWAGYGVFQAGGAAYFGIKDYDDEGTTVQGPGFIETPLLDLSGNSGSFTVKFKAKSTLAKDTIVLIVFNSDGQPGIGAVPIVNTWEEYTVAVTQGGADMSIRITTAYDTFFVDDIQILQESGSTSLETSKINADIFVKDNLHVVLDNSDMIKVYAVSGALITRVDGNAGENIITLPQQGAYIVKVGNTATKVIK